MGIKVGHRCALRVYTLILPKFLNVALAPEIVYLGVSKYQKLSFDYENSFRPHIEISEKVSICSSHRVIANLGVIRYQECLLRIASFKLDRETYLLN